MQTIKTTSHTAVRNGTGFRNEVDCSYQTLVKLFGEPGEGDGYTVDAEWILTTPHGIATVYNYKTGHNYLGDEGIDTDKIRDWHIGAHLTGEGGDAALIVLAAIEAAEAMAA